MKLLLDTHVCLWALSDPGKLVSEVADALVDPKNEVNVSAVSAWEIAIKQSLGKLALPGPAEDWLPMALAQTGIEWIPVTSADALRVRALPWFHRDPFDRLLIAQAMAGYTLVSKDDRLKPYDVTIMKA